jgi:ribonucleoside-diphosphate reductase alpha chain
MVESKKRVREKVLSGKTYEIRTGCGDLYITINSDSIGIFEILIKMGKGGGCASAQNEVAGRLITTALRHGVPIKALVKQISGISCHSVYGVGNDMVTSCSDAIVKAITKHMEGDK